MNPRRWLAFGVSAAIVAAAAALGGTVATTKSLGDPSEPVGVQIDATDPGEPVSPLIRGINGDLTSEEMIDVGIRLGSWGGNPMSRYNYIIGHAWNTAADYEFRNVNYAEIDTDAFRDYAALNAAAGAETRLAVPTLGWIAKNDDLDTCSFPDGNGGCEVATSTCDSPGRIADPEATSIESTPEMVAEWVAGLVADGIDVRFIAMDNEPDLWGHTHYDVHPVCPTFEELLDKYVSYAQAIRVVAPDAELLGPVICCWYDYWNPPVEPADGSDEDFLSWFLAGVREADEEFGQRTLDILDVHYYPQSDVFNDNTDPDTNARRLRSTRSLWDPDYVDESWIDEPIRFIPRMQETIERSYPGTPLAITEWNFGAEESMNGALVIADVLGIYGREGVYAAAYWRSPDPQSPGYFAFKMHGNYDNQGTAFEGSTIAAQSTNVDLVSAFAALDEESGVLRIMLVNKHPDADVTVNLDIAGFDPATEARRFTYGPADPSSIVEDSVTSSNGLVIPASSIVVLEVAPAT